MREDDFNYDDDAEEDDDDDFNDDDDVNDNNEMIIRCHWPSGQHSYHLLLSY